MNSEISEIENTIKSQIREICREIDPSLDWQKRFIKILDTNNNLQIQINSENLNLKQKIEFERSLVAKCQPTIPNRELLIYFKNLNQGSSTSPPNAFKPKKSSHENNPYGLKIKKKAIPFVQSIVLVASGKGGVGKSTVSTNLAVSLQKKGLKVGLLDADVYGPSNPMMMGLKGPMPINQQGKVEPLQGHGVKVVSFGFLTDGYNPVIWRGPLVGKAIEQLCYDVAWGELDILVVDLPPGTGDVQISMIERLPINGAVIVSTPQDIALIDAHKAVSMFEKLEVPIIGLVENMAHYHCPNCGFKDHIFSSGSDHKFAEERGLKKLASVPLSPFIREAGDKGVPISLQTDQPLESQFATIAEAIIKVTQ